MGSRTFVVGGAAALAVAALAPPSSAVDFGVRGVAYDINSVTVTGGAFTNANGYAGFEYAKGWIAQNATIASHPETYERGTWHGIAPGEYTDGTPLAAEASTGLIAGTSVTDPSVPFPTLGPAGTGAKGFFAFPGTIDVVPAAPMTFPELGRSGLAVFLGRYTVTGGTISGVLLATIPRPGDPHVGTYFDVDSTALAPVFSDNGVDLGLYLRPRPGFANSFDIYVTDVPTPGGAALLGAAGLAVTRRRRGAR